jgi:hypothetical protein
MGHRVLLKFERGYVFVVISILCVLFYYSPEPELIVRCICERIMSELLLRLVYHFEVRIHYFVALRRLSGLLGLI